MLNNKFEEIDLDNEKIKKIIECSYKVFVSNDLEKASTNMIVKKAGISRGILYHYFKDKQELFDFLIYFSLKKSLIEINKNMDINNGDIIERVKKLTLSRIKLMNQYPGLLEFVEKYRFLMIDHMVESGISNYRTQIYEENIDISLFHNQNDIKDNIKVIYWTFKGILKEYNEQLNSDTGDMNQAIKQCEHYAVFLKQTLYTK